jgi:hypothetical protein
VPPYLRTVVEDVTEAFDVFGYHHHSRTRSYKPTSFRDTLTGLAGARFDNQLFKANKPLLEFADQVAQNDLLPTCLLDNVKKPEWAKPRKSHGKAFGWSFTGAEAAQN